MSRPRRHISLALLATLVAGRALAAETDPDPEPRVQADGAKEALAPGEADKLVVDSLRLLANKDPVRARRLLVARLKRLPSPDPVLLAALANVCMAEAKHPEALALARKAHAIKPDYDWPLNIGVSAMIHLRLFPEAQEWIAALNKLGHQRQTSVLRGDWHRAQGNLMAADRFYGKALAEKPDDKALRDLKSWNLENAIGDYAAAHRPDETIAFLYAIIEDDPGYDAHKHMGRARAATGDWEGADQSFATSRDRFPSPETRERLFRHRMDAAKHFYFAHSYREAQDWLNLAAKVHAGPEVDALRADIYRQLGQYSKAERYYRRVHRKEADFAHVFEARAWNFTLAGNHALAEAALRDAIKAAPEDPRFHVALAVHYKNRGRIREAMAALADARALCRDKASTTRFDEIYPLDFFDDSPASGLALDGIGIPAALAAEARADKRLSNVESLIRGLGLQRISPDRHDLHLPPRVTPFATVGAKVNVYGSYVPLLNLHFQRTVAQAKDEDIDPSLAQSHQQTTLEVPWWVPWLGSWHLGFLPFVRHTTSSGFNTDNERGRGGTFHDDQLALGVQTVVQPGQGNVTVLGVATRAETKGGQGHKPVPTFTYALHGYASPLEWLATDVGVELMVSPFDPAGSRLTRREARVGAAWLFARQSSLGLSLKDVLYEDRMDGGTVRTHVSVPRAELKLWPDPVFGIEAGMEWFRADTYHAYDHASQDVAVVFVPRWIAQRSLGGKTSVPYAVPLEMRLGYALHQFPMKGVEAGTALGEQRRFTAVSYGIRFYW